MLKPRQMSRLLIVASRQRMFDVIRTLYLHHLFHIEEFVEQVDEAFTGFTIGTPLEGATETSNELLRLRAIENTFLLKAESETVFKRLPAGPLKERISREFPVIASEIEKLVAKRSVLDAAYKELEQKISDLKPFAPFPYDLDVLRGYENLAVYAGKVKQPVVPACPHEVFTTTQGKNGTFEVLIVPNAARNVAENALSDADFQATPVPLGSGPATAIIGHLEAEGLKAKDEIASVDQRLDAIKVSHQDFFLACDEALSIDIQQSEAPLRFATTDHAFIAEGWVPSDCVGDLKAVLQEATGAHVYVMDLEVDPVHDKVPVEYENPPFVRSAQVLMDVYSRPSYSELDPTLFLSIIFPIFFGLILGDVGYGAILLLVCMGLREFAKGEEAGYLLKTLRNASISSIVFGILYSEFLGFPLPWSPIIFSRHLIIGGQGGGHGPNIPGLMVMAIWIGIFHITLGRVLGMANHARQDHGAHRVKAVLANLGWIMVMWGLLMAIWSAFPIPYMPDFTQMPTLGGGISTAIAMGVFLIVAGLVLIARDSALEIVEIPAVVSNVFSYARIMAVGLSSVAIAMVVNYIGIGMLIAPHLEHPSILGVISVIAGVVVFVIGHLGNTALGIIGGGLHSIRLHYVEFFTKFYKGGGIKYSPFGINRRFTEE
jgi:V/A-type H+-transporting ATPase subunit I